MYVLLNDLKQLPLVVLELEKSEVGNSVTVHKKYEPIQL